MVQVLFAQKYIKHNQVTPDIFSNFKVAGTKLVVASSPKGYQTADSWLQVLTKFLSTVNELGIQLPVVLML